MCLDLRVASPADLPAIVRLMNVAYRGVGAQASWNSEAGVMEGDRTTEVLLAEEIAAKAHGVMLVVDGEEGGTGGLRGCVWLEPVSEGRWYLGSLSVDPRLQRSGLGRELLKAAERYAATRGGRTMEMKVLNVRESLIAWYERRGYRVTAKTSPFPYGDERFGRPLREDLLFVVLERTIDRGGLPG